MPAEGVLRTRFPWGHLAVRDAVPIGRMPNHADRLVGLVDDHDFGRRTSPFGPDDLLQRWEVRPVVGLVISCRLAELGDVGIAFFGRTFGAISSIDHDPRSSPIGALGFVPGVAVIGPEPMEYDRFVQYLLGAPPGKVGDPLPLFRRPLGDRYREGGERRHNNSRVCDQLGRGGMKLP